MALKIVNEKNFLVFKIKDYDMIASGKFCGNVLKFDPNASARAKRSGFERAHLWRALAQMGRLDDLKAIAAAGCRFEGVESNGAQVSSTLLENSVTRLWYIGQVASGLLKMPKDNLAMEAAWDSLAAALSREEPELVQGKAHIEDGAVVESIWPFESPTGRNAALAKWLDGVRKCALEMKKWKWAPGGAVLAQMALTAPRGLAVIAQVSPFDESRAKDFWPAALRFFEKGGVFEPSEALMPSEHWAGGHVLDEWEKAGKAIGGSMEIWKAAATGSAPALAMALGAGSVENPEDPGAIVCYLEAILDSEKELTMFGLKEVIDVLYFKKSGGIEKSSARAFMMECIEKMENSGCLYEAMGRRGVNALEWASGMLSVLGKPLDSDAQASAASIGKLMGVEESELTLGKVARFVLLRAERQAFFLSSAPGSKVLLRTRI